MTASRVPADRAHRVPGEAGAWVFIVGDMAIFSALFAVILYYRGQEPEVFAQSQDALNQGLGLLNTVLLLMGSILVVLATRAIYQARHDAAGRLLAGGIACGLGFTAVKAVEYATRLDDGISVRTNDFYLVFFVITAVHLLHVLLGTAVLALLRRRVFLGLPGSRDRSLFESGACYWHMVDLLWLVLFPLFYLVN